MNKLALSLPYFGRVSNPAGLRFSDAAGASGTQLATLLSEFIALSLYIAGFMMFFWLAWGVFEYILARGNKESLAKARARIWWALLGFLILAIAVFISQYAQSLYFGNGINTLLEPVKDPTQP